nr:immunoglobulin light chain junction region [Macaca mulatta]
CMQGLEFPWTS